MKGIFLEMLLMAVAIATCQEQYYKIYNNKVPADATYNASYNTNENITDIHHFNEQNGYTFCYKGM